MKAKKLLKKLLSIILIIIVIISSFRMNVFAEDQQVVIDKDALMRIFTELCNDVDYQYVAGFRLTPEEWYENNGFGEYIEDAYTMYYNNSEESDTETRAKTALEQAIEEAVDAFGAGEDMLHKNKELLLEKADSEIDSQINATTEEPTEEPEEEEPKEPIETDSPLVVDKAYLQELLMNYLLFTDSNIGVETASNKADQIVNIYGDDIIYTYSKTYNDNSSITDPVQRCETALKAALAEIDDEDSEFYNKADDIVAFADINTELNGNDSGGGVAGIVAGVGGALASFLNGIVGIFFYFVKLLPMMGARVLMSIIGLAVNGSDSVMSGLSLDQILFNEVPILGINFFETATGVNADTVNLIREQVSIWYVAIRNIAAVILAIMALYIGIRMAISSVAEEKARYKRMLTDWVVSIVLLFVLHYIMIFIININDGLVEVLKIARNGSTNGATVMEEAYDNAMSFSDILSFTSQLANMVIYVMLAVMTFIFFCTYVKRMVTIAFLIMISPLITVTYSIDRMGDGKSQALNTWFKNFVYNILLQPFQCVTYLALVQTAITSMSADDISTVVVAIIMVFFMFEAEDIIKEIFHFQGKSVAKTVAQAALVTSAIGAVSKAASAGAKVKGYASRGNPKTNQKPATTNPTAPGGAPANGIAAAANAAAGTGGIGGAANTAGAATGARGMTNPATPTATASANTTGANSGSNRSGGGNPILRTIGGVAKFGFKQAGKLPLAIMLGAAGLATGRVENAISGYNTGMNISNGVISGMEENSNLRKFAKDYKDIAGQTYQGRDDAWIRDHTKALLDGSEQYQPYEEDYYNLVRAEQDRYIDSGLSADDAITQVEQNVAGVQRGNISEISAVRRFTGNIRRKFNNRFTH